jgi:hypothetical protein
MANGVNFIQLGLTTGSIVDASTDGWVYLGIGGREFRVARPDIDDFQFGQTNSYRFGAGANVEFPGENDPRTPPLSDVGSRPVYIRFRALDNNRADAWLLKRAKVTVNGSELPRYWMRDLSGNGIWLGRRQGEILGLDMFS